ncbi:hypothetical protein [uncultured Duncaniella sp.]|uniref:hypothetical protein n=1 Tax=uncultured Duncaniella sp. TaxID=2768039 RepID=UPI002675AEBF|nr:hypothetical protein [uncultured Duncaniella sp.]
MRPYPPQTYPAAQEWADYLRADPEGSDNPRTTPEGVCLNFAAGCTKHCEQIGVRVLTRALHRHRCLCSGVTLVDAIDTHLHHTHTIASRVNRRGEIQGNRIRIHNF